MSVRVSSSCSMMLQNEAEAVVTFWMSDVHALLPMFPIQAPHNYMVFLDK